MVHRYLHLRHYDYPCTFAQPLLCAKFKHHWPPHSKSYLGTHNVIFNEPDANTTTTRGDAARETLPVLDLTQELAKAKQGRPIS